MYRNIIGSLSKSLQLKYGNHRFKNGTSPIDFLIYGILSQNTSDFNARKAFESLKESFPDYDSVIKAKIEDIENAIHVGGLHHRKARLIKLLLKNIWDIQHHFDLSFLKEMEPDDAKRYLVSFKGIGLKTACYCLLFGLNMPVMPVNSRVMRITRRLGLIDYDTTAEDTHLFYQQFLDKKEILDMHINMDLLGKEVCKSSKTYCAQCALAKKCRYFVVNQAVSKKTA